MVTHPACFEYTSAYLARIGYEVYTTKYKNFQYKSGEVSIIYNLACEVEQLQQMQTEYLAAAEEEKLF